MKQATHSTETSEASLEREDLILLMQVRRSLKGDVIFLGLMCTLFVFVLFGAGWVIGSAGYQDRHVPWLILFWLAFFVPLAMLGRVLVGKARQFRHLVTVLRSPGDFRGTVVRGELGGIRPRNGFFHYQIDGECFPVLIPVGYARDGKLELVKSAHRFDGLPKQPVVLRWLPLPGARAPLLLGIDYIHCPAVVTERKSTAEECRDVAAWDFTGLRLWMLGLLFISSGVAWFVIVAPVAAAVVLLLSALAALRMRRKLTNWANVNPRTLIVTGVIVEVLDSPVSMARTTGFQRWYRIGGRLYPTGMATPPGATSGLACGAEVRVVYVDRSPRGGRIMSMESLVRR